MKIIHITKLPDGGASWCAMRISHALTQQGIDSKMLLMQGTPNKDISIANIDWLYKEHKNILIRLIMKVIRLILRPKFERLIYLRKKAAKNGNTFFTSPVTAYTNIINHPLIKEADIVHLHWVSDFIDFPSFFKKIHKPIVWTIHDENPGLGGFHYALHKNTASKEYLALDKKYEIIKHKAVNGKNRPHLVAISQMMYSFFEKNKILKNCPITLIYNGVDCNTFHPLDSFQCRQELNIPNTKKVFLFSSYQIEDERKGLHILIPALDALKNNDIILICLGNYKAIPQSKYIEIKCAGMIKDTEILSKYYSAADYFVLSSFQEAFAQTPLEAMACGTPVIAFPCSGIPELINKDNGVICEDFTINALSKGISQAISSIFDNEKIREDILTRFAYDVIAKQYIKLYKDILNKEHE